MNTTISTTTTTTMYMVVRALFNPRKFEVESLTTNQTTGQTVSRDYLRTESGSIRTFSSRNGARKAITRQLRKLAGVPGALHK